MARKKNEKSLTLVKVPLQRRVDDRSQIFPHQPILYLELFENKSKIRPELINKFYDPDPATAIGASQMRSPSIYGGNNRVPSPTPSVQSMNRDLFEDKFLDKFSPEPFRDGSDEDRSRSGKRQHRKHRHRHQYEQRQDVTATMRNGGSDDELDFDSKLDRMLDAEDTKNIEPSMLRREDKSSGSDSESDLSVVETARRTTRDYHNENVSKELGLRDHASIDNASRVPKVAETSDNASEVPVSENGDGDGDEDDLSNRLKELLDDNNVDSDIDLEKSTERKTSRDKYAQHRDASGHSIDRGGFRGMPSVAQEQTTSTGGMGGGGGYAARSSGSSVPTLKELEASGGYVPKRELRNINVPSASERQEDDLKRELQFKFDLLRRSYPQASLPEFTIHTDYSIMKQSYDDCVRRLSLDSTVDTYKKYMMYGFMGCEYVLGHFLGLDMQGFTQQQMASMSSYEKLLIELGEKSYVPTGSKWPVEVRLLSMIIMNAAFFLVAKMIMKKTGENLLGALNSSTARSAEVNKPRRRMREPTMDVTDLPDLG